MKLLELNLINVFGMLTRKMSFKTDENYLVGINGSGKTTILKIIVALFNQNYKYFMDLPFDLIGIKYLVDNEIYNYEIVKNMEEVSLPMTDAEKSEFKNVGLTIDYQSMVLSSLNLGFDFHKSHPVLDLGIEREMDEEKIVNFFKSINILEKEKDLKGEIYKFLPPFEKSQELLLNRSKLFLKEKSEMSRDKENDLLYSFLDDDVQDKLKSMKNKAKSPIDGLLQEVIEKFIKEFSISLPNDIDNYINSFNRIFKYTNKKMKFDKVSGEFNIFHMVNKNIQELPIDNLNHLSSGEKQMFILLTNIAFSTIDDTLIIMDEPEISLHMEWQVQLFKNIKKLMGKKNYQLIVATHSPYITKNIHKDKYIGCYPFGSDVEC